MVAELTPHYDERTTLVGFRFLFGWLGGGGITALAYLWLLAPGDRAADGLRNASGYAGASRPRLSWIRCERRGQGGWNSGRQVRRRSTGAAATRRAP